MDPSGWCVSARGTSATLTPIGSECSISARLRAREEAEATAAHFRRSVIAWLLFPGSEAPRVLPLELSTLLDAASPAVREAAWTRFVETHNRLLLHVARNVDRDHDAAMDAYAHVLEQFRSDDFRRLRAYASDGRSKFTTWLVVVTRRLCLDHVRQRYGRAQDSSARAEESQAIRRRLVDSIAEAIDADDLADAASGDAEMQLRTAELERALTAAVDGLEPRDRLLL